MERASVDSDPEFPSDIRRYDGCPLSLSLIACFYDAGERGRPALLHLRDAITELGARPPATPAELGLGGAPGSLACYLSFLLPEVRQRSPLAATFVRRAIETLRHSGPDRGNGLRQ